MTITLEQAREFGAYLASRHGCTVIDPTQQPGAAISAAIDGITALSPVVKLLVDAIDSLQRGASHTLPIPGTSPCRSLVILARDAASTPVGYAATVAHECQHGAQGVAEGSGQVLIDYIMSTELRGLREAQAYSVGAFVRHLLTGDPYDVDAAVASLSGPLYGLDAKDIELARHCLAGHAVLVDRRRPPPLTVALEARDWLLEHAPEAIGAAGWVTT